MSSWLIFLQCHSTSEIVKLSHMYPLGLIFHVCINMQVTLYNSIIPLFSLSSPVYTMTVFIDNNSVFKFWQMKIKFDVVNCLLYVIDCHFFFSNLLNRAALMLARLFSDDSVCSSCTSVCMCSGFLCVKPPFTVSDFSWPPLYSGMRLFSDSPEYSSDERDVDWESVEGRSDWDESSAVGRV